MRYFLDTVCLPVRSVNCRGICSTERTARIMSCSLSPSELWHSPYSTVCEHGPLSFIGISGIAVLAWWLGTDYDWRGVLMIAVFYILRHQTMRPWLERSSTNFPSQAILQIIFTFPLMAHYGIAGALLASAIIFLYDGAFVASYEANRPNTAYAIYPVHLMLLSLFS